MERFSKTTVIIFVIYMATAMIVSPTGSINAAHSAILLCLDAIIPALFPFFVCSNLLISLGVARYLSRCFTPFTRLLFGVSGSGALPVVLGIISGYPVGASCTAQLYSTGNCTKTEAQRLLAFCNNSGPLFILGAVGIGMFNNQKIGVLLYISHILSAIIVGMIFKHYGTTPHTLSLPPSVPNKPASVFSGITDALSDAISSILKVCGFVILFAVFTSVLPQYKGHEFIYALTEITGGIKALICCNQLGNFLLPAISFFLAFSGISVMMQVAGIVIPHGLSLKTYALGKILQGLFSFALTYILQIVFPVASPVFMPDGNIYTYPILSPRELFAIALLCITFGLITILVMLIIGWISDKFYDE